MKQVEMQTATRLIIENIAGFYIRTVTPLGNSAKVDCPKGHLGKKVYLVVIKE
jgi:putative transposon-encoded protein